MGDGLMFAALSARLGVKHGARYGNQFVTVGSVGWKDGERFVMATADDGTVCLGAPHDFSIPVKRTPKPRKRRARPLPSSPEKSEKK